MSAELKQRIEDSRAAFDELKVSLKIEDKIGELRRLESEMEKPDFWNDQGRAKGIVVELKTVKAITGPFEKLEGGLSELETLVQLAEEESCDDTWAEAAKQQDVVESDLERLRVQALLAGPNDHRDAYLSVHAGAGGVDACDWASMLHRMYGRYAERAGFSVREVDILPETEAGIRNVTLHVKGTFVYGMLRSEIGVHRLVRISPFDAQKRRQTSFAAVDVLPDFEGDEIEIDIQDSDLRVDLYSAGGPGGQHVNKTQSAVRIVHQPSGITVQCQNERSQHANRRQAMALLQARLFRFEEQKRDEELKKLYGEKGEIAWGHQIRSYTLQPFTLVKDHRTGVETSNTNAVLDGDLTEFIEAYLQQKAEAEA